MDYQEQTAPQCLPPYYQCNLRAVVIITGCHTRAGGSPNLWLGVRVLASGKFYNQDLSPADYANWASELVPATSLECGHMEVVTGE